MLSAILTFVPASVLLVIAPGPDTLLVLRNAARGGRRAGLATAAGTVTGLLIWAAAAALGLAALVRASQIGYLAVRWAGAGYLVFLGSRLIWLHWRRRGGEEQFIALPGTADSRPLPGYLTGAGTNLLNPKVGVFFVSFLPVFIPRGVPVAPAALILGSVFITEGIVWLGLIALVGDRLSVVLSRAGVRRRMEQLTGLVMIGFGIRLALERR